MQQENIIFYYSPIKVKKESTLSNPRKEEYKRNLLPPEIKTQAAYTGKKLSTCFNVKDHSKFDHQRDIVYCADCPNETCRENYIGESGRRISKRIKDHIGRDLKSHILRHSVESGHVNVSYDFKIMVKNFNNTSRKSKTAESLLIKEKRRRTYTTNRYL